MKRQTEKEKEQKEKEKEQDEKGKEQKEKEKEQKEGEQKEKEKEQKEEEQTGCIYIGVWTFKGGVTKSTTTHSLAYAFANRGYNVMVADCDAQRDLTYLMFGGIIERDYDGFTKNFVSRPGPVNPLTNAPEPVVRTMVDAISPLFDNDPTDVLTPEPELKLARTKNTGSIHAVLGHHNNDSLSTKIAQAHAQYNHINSLKRHPGAPFNALMLAAAKCKEQIVLLDLPPDATPLTATLLMQCDYWISPVNGDCLSREAIHNGMEKVTESEYASDSATSALPPDHLRSWLERHKVWVEISRGTNCPVRNVVPKFLGVVLCPFVVLHRQAGETITWHLRRAWQSTCQVITSYNQ